MEIEIISLDENDTGTGIVMIANIPNERKDIPPLPGKEHEEEWEEFWAHKKEAAEIHLGAAILIQTELTEEQIKDRR